jgi:hypothetical protein
MTPVPPPASPCLRVRLDYKEEGNELGGSRFYLSYSGSAPSGANCVTLATDIAGAWESHIAGLVNEDYSLTEVDVLDIATDSGNSGQWTGLNQGTRAGTAMPAQVATNVEFDIARRYRGGKPRMFLPAGVTGDEEDDSHWSSAFITAVNTGVAAFFSEVEGFDVGSVGTLAHVNLSFYKGFTNVTNPSGRTRAVPSYRAAALLDTVEGYSAKAVMGSQKRRRTATTY